MAVGETLTLRCTTSGLAEPGPVKWLKGLGNGNKTIYDQREKDLSAHVTRAVVGSDTDFTIHIRNFQPSDVGTYYCVKFIKEKTGEEMSQHGSGTEVSMRGECSPAGRCSQGPHPTVPTLPTARSCSAPHPPPSALPLSPQRQPCFLAWWLQLWCSASSSSSLASLLPFACTGGSAKAGRAARAQLGQWPWAASRLSLCSAVQGPPAPPGLYSAPLPSAPLNE